jgi:hypothetical protein
MSDIRFNGMQVRTSVFLTVPYEDWSDVRSPGRARRRMKRGFRQRVRYLQIADPKVVVIHGVIHGHPDTVKKMFELAERQGGAA